jgi:hypothetical protein
MNRSEQDLIEKGWVRNRRGALEPGAQAALSMPLDAFAAWYGKQNPRWEQAVYDDFAESYGSDPKKYEYSLAYANAVQALGLPHEEAVAVARVVAQSGDPAAGVQTESVHNRRMAVLPLSSQLPAVQAAVEQMRSSKPVAGGSGRRMAMRYGAPALGALLGLYGLSALTDGSEPERVESGVER